MIIFPLKIHPCTNVWSTPRSMLTGVFEGLQNCNSFYKEK